MVSASCLLALGLLVPTLASMTHSDACGFVAAKLFKYPESSCRAQVCTFDLRRIGVPLRVHRPILSCDDAMAMTKAVFADSPDSKESKKRKRTELSPFDEILATIDSSILAGLESFLFKDVFAPELMDGMRTVSAGLMREAAVWSRFKRDHQGDLRTATRDVEKLILEIFTKAQYTLATVDRMAESLGPIANFFFDITAFAQRTTGGLGAYAVTQQMAVSGQIGYRVSHAAEWREPLGLVAPGSAAFFISVSQAMSVLARQMRRGPNPQEGDGVKPLIDWVTRPREADASTVRLVEDQLRLDFCRAPIAFLAAAMRHFPSPFGSSQERLRMMAFVVPILRLCTDARPVVNESVMLRMMLTEQTLRAANLTLTDEIPDSVSYFLFGSGHSFLGNIRGSAAQVHALIDRFLAEVDPLIESEAGVRLRQRGEIAAEEARGFAFVPNTLEVIMANFGKLVAIALRANVSVARFGLPASFVDAIHSMDLTGETIRVAESIYYFNQGAVNVLGVMSFGAFPLADLHARFGTRVSRVL